MKIVLDANVLVAAFGTRGLCSELFAYCLFEHKITTSEFIINETIKSLQEDFSMPQEKTQEHRQFLLNETTVVEPLDIPQTVLRNPSDVKILGTAWADKVDVIITGDKDLLELGEFKGISILSPRQFWEKTRKL